MAPKPRVFLIRVRSSAGTWRVSVPNGPSSTVAEVKALVEAQYSVSASIQKLCADPGGQRELEDAASLEELGLGENGALCYLVPQSADVPLPVVRAREKDAHAAAHNESKKSTIRRKIGPDGTIIAEAYDDHVSKRGFRPGMKALGDMKKSWTLTDFLAMDDQ